MAMNFLCFLALVCGRDTTKERVVFVSPTKCEGTPHGVYRWHVKIDQARPTLHDVSPSITPADISKWAPPAIAVKADSGRLRGSAEDQFWQLTGVVVLVKLEDDGDIHIQLANKATGEDTQVVVEVPLGPPWDAIRKEICSWSEASFPRGPGELKLRKKPVIRVLGKAFWDGQHAAKEGSMRNYDKQVSCWEIHPVLRMTVLEHEVH